MTTSARQWVGGECTYCAKSCRDYNGFSQHRCKQMPQAVARGGLAMKKSVPITYTPSDLLSLPTHVNPNYPFLYSYAEDEAKDISHSGSASSSSVAHYIVPTSSAAASSVHIDQKQQRVPSHNQKNVTSVITNNKALHIPNYLPNTVSHTSYNTNNNTTANAYLNNNKNAATANAYLNNNAYACNNNNGSSSSSVNSGNVSRSRGQLITLPLNTQAPDFVESSGEYSDAWPVHYNQDGTAGEDGSFYPSVAYSDYSTDPYSAFPQPGMDICNGCGVQLKGPNAYMHTCPQLQQQQHSLSIKQIPQSQHLSSHLLGFSPAFPYSNMSSNFSGSPSLSPSFGPSSPRSSSSAAPSVLSATSASFVSMHLHAPPASPEYDSSSMYRDDGDGWQSAPQNASPYHLSQRSPAQQDWIEPSSQDRQYPSYQQQSQQQPQHQAQHQQYQQQQYQQQQQQQRQQSQQQQQQQLSQQQHSKDYNQYDSTSTATTTTTTLSLRPKFFPPNQQLQQQQHLLSAPLSASFSNLSLQHPQQPSRPLKFQQPPLPQQHSKAKTSSHVLQKSIPDKSSIPVIQPKILQHPKQQQQGLRTSQPSVQILQPHSKPNKPEENSQSIPQILSPFSHQQPSLQTQTLPTATQTQQVSSSSPTSSSPSTSSPTSEDVSGSAAPAEKKSPPQPVKIITPHKAKQQVKKPHLLPQILEEQQTESSTNSSSVEQPSNQASQSEDSASQSLISASPVHSKQTSTPQVRVLSARPRPTLTTSSTPSPHTAKVSTLEEKKDGTLAQNTSTQSTSETATAPLRIQGPAVPNSRSQASHATIPRPQLQFQQAQLQQQQQQQQQHLRFLQQQQIFHHQQMLQQSILRPRQFHPQPAMLHYQPRPQPKVFKSQTSGNLGPQ